jgi:hypothetical protein
MSSRWTNIHKKGLPKKRKATRQDVIEVEEEDSNQTELRKGLPKKRKTTRQDVIEVEEEDPNQTELRKRVYNPWKEEEEEAILEWIETPGNYDLWKGSGRSNINGKKVTTGMTKISIQNTISQQLKDAGFDRQGDAIKNKISSYELSWKKASMAFKGTGFGVTEADEKDDVDGVYGM